MIHHQFTKMKVKIRLINIFVILLLCIDFHGYSQDIECNLITDSITSFLPVPLFDKPEYLQSITDPTFGTKITRIVGDPGDTIPNLDGVVWASEQERHDYSKRQVWNSDQSMMYLGRHSPNLWLDGETYQVLFTRSKKPSSYLRWSHTEPEIMYHTGKSGDCHIGKWNVLTDTSEELIDLRAYTSCTFGEGEGNFSTDGLKAAVYGKRIQDGKYVVFVVDVENKSKGPDIELDGIILKNCTISPKGDYVIICHDEDNLWVVDAGNGTLAWEETRYGLPSHFDVQIDQNGDEVVVGVGKTSPYSGLVIKRRLADGFITALTKSGYASHTSGRNLNRPGWVFVTFQNLSTNSKYLPYINEMDAVKLDGSRVERICNLRVDKSLLPSEDRYYFEAHGCPSPDGRRVIFASDWDAGSYPVQAYIVDFRDKIIPGSELNTSIAIHGRELAELNCFPNPFSVDASIRFKIPVQANVMVQIFSLTGTEIATIFNQAVIPDQQYTIPLDGASLSKGIYFVQLRYDMQIITKRIILL